MTLFSKEFSGTPAEKERWFIALNRFGLGAKLGQINSVEGKPEDWLINQINQPTFNFPSAFPSSKEFIEKNGKIASSSNVQTRDKLKKSFSTDYNQYILRQLQNEISTSSGFELRVLNFFSNHFSVSKGNPFNTALAPTLEKEAIAPNIFAKFEQLLVNVVKHPAMIRYLDNQTSFGPNSKLGLKKNKGLNENLAREILELHTMGVDGGYSQNDVEALARGITGWSTSFSNEKNITGFRFRSWGHEPGDFTLLGKTFSNNNIHQGEAMLSFIARHESTARYVCGKIASHFAGPNAPASLLKKLVETWNNSSGDLKQVFKCLIKSEEPWMKGNFQYKKPRDYVISVLRALPQALHPSYREIHKSLTSFGQGPFMAGSPAGFEQDESYWNTPLATINRIDWVGSLVQSYTGQLEKVIQSQCLDGLTENQVKAIYGAETKQKALFLYLISPYFMRR